MLGSPSPGAEASCLVAGPGVAQPASSGLALKGDSRSAAGWSDMPEQSDSPGKQNAALNGKQARERLSAGRGP
jgi:hypothetical protein